MVLTIHHLGVSQSERLLWLCEELGVKYELKTYKRAPLLAPPEYKALHPAGTSPVIQDDDGSDKLVTLAESSACVEYVSHKHGGGQLFLGPSHPQYADFLYWFHFANGTFMPALSRVMASSLPGADSSSPMAGMARERFAKGLAALNNRLRDNEWLAGGAEFTAADIMAVFPLTTMRYYFPYSLAEHPNITKYLERVGQRPAYQRAMKIGDPDMQPLLAAEAPAKDAK
ncbi:putative glutathione S-transferase [Lasiosphaeria miniovina]|uniref:Glutathione S-transferase n=1 Tax=Lasiosphaeria miniovina TaxID=1954250 RepID=A0AA40BG08_9PEZI|nr:putative glutathione S-transferase [Lasiosphaeria miniovina]KAK0733569.1 putative glutathione S-transferase [Lasiosphaeria miniovina]